MNFFSFKYRQALCLSIFLSVFAITCLHARWTLIVYLAGDNNLDSAIAGEQVLRDLNNLELGIDTASVSAIVLADRRGGPPDGDGNTFVYDIRHDTVPHQFGDSSMSYGIATSTKSVSLIMPSAGNDELNMGDPVNLIAFSTWTITEYPADNYMLVLWNHGGGWYPKAPVFKKGIAWDDTSEDDFLSTEELGTALKTIKELLPAGKKIDIILFDACLMASVEVAYEIKDCAYYMVASEEKESGFPYDDILEAISSNPGYDSRQLCQKIVDLFDICYSTDSSLYSGTFSSRTASAIELSKVSDLAVSIDVLADMLISKISVPAFYNVIGSIRSGTEYFGTSEDDNEYYGCIDIYDLADKIENSNSFNYTDLKSAASSVKSAVKSCVFANKTGSDHPNSGGISINFPLTSESWNERNNPDYNYETLKFSQDTLWASFLGKYFSSPYIDSKTLFNVTTGPNPFIPSAGNVKILNFPANSDIKVKIYNLEGILVRKISGSGSYIEWDGKNSQGSTVASGIYFYVADTDNGTVKGKFTVINK